MNKTSQARLIFLLLPGIIIIGLFSLMLVSAPSVDEEDDRLIGYEFINSSGDVVPYANAETVHIWNNASIGNYYFDKDSGIQFSNHYNDYWTKNVFCIGYYDGEEWNKIACADELENFNKSISTDNSTYVSATLWKDIILDIEEGEYDFRLGINYYLELNDKNLTITIYGKNIDGEDIPVDLGFAWRIKDIKINGDEENDRIFINDDYYDLHDNSNESMEIDLSFANLNESYFKLEDSWYVQLDWDNNLTYKIEIKNVSDQYNAPVTLGINAGKFNSNVEKSTILYWQDPPAAPAWTGNLGATPNPVTKHNNITYTGTANDNGGDASLDWFLIVCSTDSIDYMPAAPNCDTGVEICRSSDMGSWDVEANCQYNTTSESAGDITYYGFLCSTEDDRCSDAETKSATTTVEIVYGTLNVEIDSPTDNSNWYESNENLTVNTTVTCVGAAGADCGIVYAYANYNVSSGTPDTLINATMGGLPFYVYKPEGDYINQTDGFKTSVGGANLPRGVAFDERDDSFWVVDWTTVFVYHFDSSGVNQTDGFDIGDSGIDSPVGITFNTTDFWITDYNDNYVYHFDSSGVDQLDGFSVVNGISSALVGVAYDNRDHSFWTVDIADFFIYHFDSSGVNQTDGFKTNGAGSESPYEIILDERDNSFWVMDSDDFFVYHFDSSGVNQTNGFKVNNAGASFPIGLTLDTTDYSFWVADSDTTFLYHFDSLGNPQSTTLSQGESYSFNWTLNVTSATEENYEIGVLFNSAYGSGNVPDNHTNNVTVNLNPSAGPADTEYPQFSNYWDDNDTFEDAGTGHFNVTLLSTNGSVQLDINGENITATNYSYAPTMFNATYTFSSGGVYDYTWNAYGNGTSYNINVSSEQSYTVNGTGNCWSNEAWGILVPVSCVYQIDSGEVGEA